METRNLQVVLGTMLVTTVVTLAFLWPAGATAKGPEKGFTAAVPKPVLRVKGCEVTVAPTQPSYGAGDQPALALRVVNDSEQPAELTLSLSLMMAPQPEVMSRVSPRPTSIFSQSFALAMKAHETREQTIATQTKLVAGRRYYFQVQEGDVIVRLDEFTPTVSGDVAQVTDAAPPARPSR